MLILGLLMTFSVWSQNELERREEPGEIVWWLDENTVDKDKHSGAVYVEKDTKLGLYPGEEIWVEMTANKRKVKSLTVVKENLQPDITAYLKLEQLLYSEGYHGEKVVTVENPFNQHLIFEVMGFVKSETKWEKVKTIRVNPNSKVEATIKEPIAGLYFENWTLE